MATPPTGHAPVFVYFFVGPEVPIPRSSRMIQMNRNHISFPPGNGRGSLRDAAPRNPAG